MSAAQIIKQIRDDGVILTFLYPDKLEMAGNKKAINKWLPIVKEHKPAILAQLAANDASATEEPKPIEPSTRYRSWLVTPHHGEPTEVHSWPPSTRAEMMAYYPDAVAVTPFQPKRKAVPLGAMEEAAIRAWLAHIQETDPATIAEVLDTCRTDIEALGYFLNRAAGFLRLEDIHEAKEAADERAAILEHEAGLAKEKADAIAGLARAFYAHLMGAGKVTNCCHAQIGRYCPEGKRLRDAYYGARS